MFCKSLRIITLLLLLGTSSVYPSTDIRLYQYFVAFVARIKNALQIFSTKPDILSETTKRNPDVHTQLLVIAHDELHQHLTVEQINDPKAYIASLSHADKTRIFDILTTRVCNKNDLRPFITGSKRTQMDTFFLLAAGLIESEQEYEPLTKELRTCIGCTQLWKLQARLSKPELRRLIPDSLAGQNMIELAEHFNKLLVTI